MRYKPNITLLILIVLIGCNQPTQFVRDNTNDPSSLNFNPDSVSNIQLVINNNFAELSWDKESDYVEGFQIIKSDNNTVFYDTTVNSSQTSIQDITLSPFDGYYQINQITKNDTVVQSESRINFRYQISEFTNSFINTDGSVQLNWNYNGYFDTNFIITRSNEYSGDELIFELQNSKQLIDDNFNNTNIGLNTYQLYPQTPIGTGDTAVTNIRLPQWSNLRNLPTEIDQAHLEKIDSNIFVIQANGQSYRYDLSSDTWLKITNTNGKFDRNRFRAQTISDIEILVLNADSYEIYDINTDSWSNLFDVPYPNVLGMAVEKIDNRHAIVTGGDLQPSGFLEPIKNTYIFDTLDKSWTRVNDMNVARAFHSLLKLDDGQTIAFGGFTNSKKIEYFNLNQNQWINLPDSPINIRKAVLSTNGNLIAVSEYSSSVFDFNSQTWSDSVRFDNAQIAYDKYNDMTLTALPDGNAILTGLTGKERAKASQIYDVSLDRWIQIGNTIDERIRSWNYITTGNKLISIGGAHFASGYTYETIDLANYLEK